MRPPAFILLAQAIAPAAEAKQYWLGNAGRFTIRWVFRCAANDNRRGQDRPGHRGWHGGRIATMAAFPPRDATRSIAGVAPPAG